MEKLIIFFICTIPVFSACNKQLEKEPKGTIAGSNFYKTQQDAELSINAVYKQLQGFWIYDVFSMANDIWSDDAEKGGGGAADTPPLDELHNHAITTSNNYIVTSVWAADWNAIYDANTCLQKIPPIAMPDAKKNQYLGEAHFLRALFYFHLIIRFGGLPLLSTPDIDSSKKAARATIEDTWDFIVNDLTQAISLLPDSYTGDDVGRATKNSAQGLLGRVYLFTKQWQKAADIYTLIINGGAHSLTPNYADNFTNEGSDNLPESIFEVQFVRLTGLGLGADRYHWTRPRGVAGLTWGGNGFDVPTQSLVDEYEPGDVRRAATVMNDGDHVFDTVYHASWSPTGHNAMKYTYGPELPVAGESDCNFKLIRYSEILLGYAEAVQNGAAGNANITGLQALNMVRERAGLADIGALTFNAIVHERRVEFALESQRFFDLVRWGIAAQVFGANFNVGKDELMPIPISEIANDPNLVQNPGY